MKPEVQTAFDDYLAVYVAVNPTHPLPELVYHSGWVRMRHYGVTHKYRLAELKEMTERGRRKLK